VNKTSGIAMENVWKLMQMAIALVVGMSVYFLQDVAASQKSTAQKLQQIQVDFEGRVTRLEVQREMHAEQQHGTQ
jgi:hypothetical protein